MSMRKSSRSELRMLRIMMWHFGIDTKCCFCKNPLLDIKDITQPDGVINLAGKLAPPPVKTKLTLHHANGVHLDNAKKNRKPCHQTCHKRHHMKERQNARISERSS